MMRCHASLHWNHYRHCHCYFLTNCFRCHSHLKSPNHFHFPDPWDLPRPSAKASLHLHLQKTLLPLVSWRREEGGTKREKCTTTVQTVEIRTLRIVGKVVHKTQDTADLQQHLNYSACCSHAGLYQAVSFHLGKPLSPWATSTYSRECAVHTRECAVRMHYCDTNMLDGTSTCSPLHCRNLSPHGKFLPVVQNSQSSAISRTTLTHTSISPVVWPSLVEALPPGGHHRTLPRPGGTWPCALGSAACTWTEIPARVPSTSPPTSAQSVS